MANSKTGANQRIKNICNSKSIDETILYAKAKLLLEIYRDVCWDTADYARMMREDLVCDFDLCSSDLDGALIYLESFAPTEKKARFTEKVQRLFEVKWMIEIVDSAMTKVREFPLTGDLYASLLSAYYLSKFPLSEQEMIEEFRLERSSLYRRKKEAIKVFGLAVWGGSIEEFRMIMTAQHEQLTMDGYGNGW